MKEAWWLKALVLTEGLDLIPSTHTMTYSHP